MILSEPKKRKRLHPPDRKGHRVPEAQVLLGCFCVEFRLRVMADAAASITVNALEKRESPTDQDLSLTVNAEFHSSTM